MLLSVQHICRLFICAIHECILTTHVLHTFWLHGCELQLCCTEVLCMHSFACMLLVISLHRCKPNCFHTHALCMYVHLYKCCMHANWLNFNPCTLLHLIIICLCYASCCTEGDMYTSNSMGCMMLLVLLKSVHKLTNIISVSYTDKDTLVKKLGSLYNNQSSCVFHSKKTVSRQW